MAGWALPVLLNQTLVIPTATALGSTPSPPGCAPWGCWRTLCQGMGGPVPGTQPLPAWHSGAVQAPASLETPPYTAHRRGVPTPGSPSQTDTDKGLPLPPEPGAEETPGPVSQALHLPSHP